jgi:acetyltransferase-like isoleucine patch superfamily enzyme
MQRPITAAQDNPLPFLHKLYARLIHYSRRVCEFHHRLLLRHLISRGHLKIGRHTYGLRAHSISGASAMAHVSIGSFCSFAPGVNILANVDHALERPSTYPFRTLLFAESDPKGNPGGFNADAVTKGSITIGHDVWVGQSALILSGVSIGTGSVIGAGAVVSRSIPPYSIAVGNPARVVRRRFSDIDVGLLLNSRWWEIPDAGLEKMLPLLYSEEIPAFAYAATALTSGREESEIGSQPDSH